MGPQKNVQQTIKKSSKTSPENKKKRYQKTLKKRCESCFSNLAYPPARLRMGLRLGPWTGEGLVEAKSDYLVGLLS